MSFMPKKGWVVGKIIDNPIDAANICDNTQIKVLNSIIKQFGKPNNKGKFYAKPVTIWAKSPINNKQIHHSTVAVRINGKIYLYDMPQSEYIKYNSENNGTVIKEYSPRLIEYTEENLKTLYGTADENIHLNDESILDNDIIELPLTNASKVIDDEFNDIKQDSVQDIKEKITKAISDESLQTTEEEGKKVEEKCGVDSSQGAGAAALRALRNKHK